jgi:peptide/nickel transport system permease protein
MLLFLTKRLLVAALLLVVVSFLVFILLTVSPGSVETTLLGVRPATPETLEAVRTEYHLNEPFLAQYWYWARDAAQLDLGRSITSGDTVTHLVSERLPVSLGLAAYTLLLVLVVGIPLGLLAGMRHGTILDRAVTTVTVLGMSAPAFAVALLLLYVFGVELGWFPVFGPGEGFVDRIHHLTLPAIALALALGALLVRQTRAAALDVMNEDYVTFARARGLGRRRILTAYALRNVSLPIVTSAGFILILALSGAVLVETVFSLPGVGSLIVESVTTKDVPVVQGVSLMLAFYVIVINVLIDLSVMVIDPRTRYAPAR